MNKTKIEYVDRTWNPVTGCRHGCDYCYARSIVRRFGSGDCRGNYDIDRPSIVGPYPYGFAPTFHRYRLDEPQRVKKPQKVFVGSMCDLFGGWVPDEWIMKVFEACEKAPRHRYFFLTKNPMRYIALAKDGMLPTEHYYGWTVTSRKDTCRNTLYPDYKTFVSFEPLHEDTHYFDYCDGSITGWAIIGAETGSSKSKVIPKREWVENIVRRCRAGNVPVFMKDSLSKIWGEPLIREYPWEEAERHHGQAKRVSGGEN